MNVSLVDPKTYNTTRERMYKDIGGKFGCYRRRSGKYSFVGYVDNLNDAQRYLEGKVVKLSNA